MNIENLARQAVRDLAPYASAGRLKAIGEISLNANEWPTPPSFLKDAASLNRYPPFQDSSLLTIYGTYAGVESTQILTCRGADEAIDLLLRSFCEAGQDAIITCPPTYGMYEISAQISGVECRKIPMTPNWDIDLNALEKNLANVKIVFLCNPNNPTGQALDSKTLESMLEITKDRALLVIDESYGEFCPAISCIPRLQANPHLVILRTLSKAFGLAGIRCGFALANPSIITLLRKIIAPYPVPTPSLAIACRALTPENIAHMQENVALCARERNRLADGLMKCPQIDTVYPSVTNFLLFRAKDSHTLWNALVNRGILLRDQSTGYRLENCLRVSIGTPDENARLLAVLKELANA